MYEDEIYTMQTESSFFTTLWTSYFYAVSMLRAYGWPLLGALLAGAALWGWLQPRLQAWRRAREDAAHHKDPDAVLARERAVRAAREALQRRQQEASRRAAELQAERQEQKRRQAAELLAEHGVAGGRRLGSGDGYLPLSGGGAGGAGSSYRAPRRSACAGGGCGR